MNLIYIYIFSYIYIYILISRSNIINLSVYEFINFRYMNVTLNVMMVWLQKPRRSGVADALHSANSNTRSSGFKYTASSAMQ